MSNQIVKHFPVDIATAVHLNDFIMCTMQLDSLYMHYKLQQITTVMW